MRDLWATIFLRQWEMFPPLAKGLFVGSWAGLFTFIVVTEIAEKLQQRARKKKYNSLMPYHRLSDYAKNQHMIARMQATMPQDEYYHERLTDQIMKYAISEKMLNPILDQIEQNPNPALKKPAFEVLTSLKDWETKAMRSTTMPLREKQIYLNKILETINAFDNAVSNQWPNNRL